MVAINVMVLDDDCLAVERWVTYVLVDVSQLFLRILRADEPRGR